MDNSTIASLLKELIIEYNRVSLPCLGSFLSGYSAAVISQDYIYPPSKQIIFHQNEIWNDEKLEKRIAWDNNISIGVAKEQLAFWIDDVCVLLATGEKVQLPGLGQLYVSDQSKLMFEQDSDNLLIESFGLVPIPINNAENVLVKTAIPQPKVKSTKNSNRILVVAALAIVLLAIVAGFTIFKHILTDRQPVPEPINALKKDNIEIIYNEYINPKYGILINSFDKYNQAREFSETIEPKTDIYIIDRDKPYAVISALYTTMENANNMLDSLKKDTTYLSSQIVSIDSFRIVH